MQELKQLPMAAGEPDGGACQLPWRKLSTPCQCGSSRFRMFKFDGIYSRACASCGLISHYLEEVLINPQPGHLTPEEVEKMVRATAVSFPLGKQGKASHE